MLPSPNLESREHHATSPRSYPGTRHDRRSIRNRGSEKSTGQGERDDPPEPHATRKARPPAAGCRSGWSGTSGAVPWTRYERVRGAGTARGDADAGRDPEGRTPV